MADFTFIKKPLSQTWTILDPRRSLRPNAAREAQPLCPFCPGQTEEELDRIPKSEYQNSKLETNLNFKNTNEKNNSDVGHSRLSVVSDFDIRNSDLSSDWLVRVLPNKFPFAPHHELIIHSPDHHKNIDELPLEQVERILQMYQKRYKEHQAEGAVIIFHNRGESAGESIPHPHTQLLVLPHKVQIETPELRDLWVLPKRNGNTVIPNTLPVIPALSSVIPAEAGIQNPEETGSRIAVRDDNERGGNDNERGENERESYNESTEGVKREKEDTIILPIETEYFFIFCPATSEWPSEVVIAPRRRQRRFSDLTMSELSDLAKVLQRSLQCLAKDLGEEFAFNYYIYPLFDWYLRIIPRQKTLGGFEVMTKIGVVTRDPAETMEKLREHWSE